MKELSMIVDNYLPLRDLVFITLREAILQAQNSLECRELLFERQFASWNWKVW